jgi:hypothetical protein
MAVPRRSSQRTTLAGSLILASRSEIKRGEWQQFQGGDYQIWPMGSVAYQLALVAAGRADITFTFTPKHGLGRCRGRYTIGEWRRVCLHPGQNKLVVKRRNPLLSAAVLFLKDELLAMLEPVLTSKERLCSKFGEFLAWQAH